MTALEGTTRGYWQAMQALRAGRDTAFNISRLQVMHAMASPRLKSLALAELERMRGQFLREVEGDVA